MASVRIFNAMNFVSTDACCEFRIFPQCVHAVESSLNWLRMKFASFF